MPEQRSAQATVRSGVGESAAARVGPPPTRRFQRTAGTRGVGTGLGSAFAASPKSGSNDLRADPKLAPYSFYWAARADIERRDGRGEEARALYARAVELAKSRAERLSYERRLQKLGN